MVRFFGIRGEGCEGCRVHAGNVNAKDIGREEGKLGAGPVDLRKGVQKGDGDEKDVPGVIGGRGRYSGGARCQVGHEGIKGGHRCRDGQKRLANGRGKDAHIVRFEDKRRDRVRGKRRVVPEEERALARRHRRHDAAAVPQGRCVSSLQFASFFCSLRSTVIGQHKFTNCTNQIRLPPLFPSSRQGW